MNRRVLNKTNILLIIVLLVGCTQDHSAYQTQIQEEIDNRIKFLQYNDQSPFALYDIPFRKPQYFKIDPTFRVTAKVSRIQGRKYRTIGASDGNSKRYLEYAWLNFFLLGEEHRLLALKPIGMNATNQIFLAFADQTSGESTYGAGRYLDIIIGKSDKVTLDFNLAYNPYCAYAADFSCPFPPQENVLNLEIQAGEKDFKK
jgi:uncharacterized protein (DUF1684 family)